MRHFGGLTGVAATHYRLLTPTGEATEEGTADAKVADGTFVLTPDGGEVLRVPFGQIASVAEAEQFTLRVALAQGTVVELSRLGVMRTQLLAEMKDAHANAAAKTAATVGEADVFSGYAGGEQVEIRVYDDALLVIGPGSPLRVSFAFVKAVTNDNYVITVEVTGSDPVVLTRLGNRSGEFAKALSLRIGDARSRSRPQGFAPGGWPAPRWRRRAGRHAQRRSPRLGWHADRNRSAARTAGGDR